jgi:hypothetical protein
VPTGRRAGYRGTQYGDEKRMALSEFEIKRTEKLVGQFVEKHRPEPQRRSQLDIGFRLDGQSFEIFEIRPQWNNPSKKIEGPVAKATYVKSRKTWNLFWKRADNKWHRYKPFPTSKSLEKILEAIETDEFGCFWG